MSVFIHQNGKRVELTGDELDAYQSQAAIDSTDAEAREAAQVARKAKREQMLKRSNAQSLPELRAKLNELIEFIGGEL